MAVIHDVRDGVSPANRTVWFWVEPSLYENPSYTETNGWQLGWHSGTRWHSYFDPAFASNNPVVSYWMDFDKPPALNH